MVTLISYLFKTHKIGDYPYPLIGTAQGNSHQDTDEWHENPLYLKGRATRRAPTVGQYLY